MLGCIYLHELDVAMDKLDIIYKRFVDDFIIMEKTKHKVICPECKGNGYIRVPYELAREEITARCDTCKCEGEITLTEEDFIDQIDKPN